MWSGLVVDLRTFAWLWQYRQEDARIGKLGEGGADCSDGRHPSEPFVPMGAETTEW